MYDLVPILVPIACGCVLPIMIVWLDVRKKMAESQNRTQIILAAIEKNPDMDIEELMNKISPKPKLLKEKLLALCCGNKSNADDLAQDAIVKAYLSSAGYQEQGKFRSWLFKIAHNTFLNHKTSCRTMETLDDARTLISSTTADNAFEHQELYLALRTLPPKERSAITLFYLNGYSIKEVAVITETSEDAVKKQLSRGRDKLRQELRMDD